MIKIQNERYFFKNLCHDKDYKSVSSIATSYSYTNQKKSIVLIQLGLLLTFVTDHAIIFAIGQLIHQYCKVAAIAFSARTRRGLLACCIGDLVGHGNTSYH